MIFETVSSLLAHRLLTGVNCYDIGSNHRGGLLAFLPILRRIFRTNPLAESLI